jgi:hypothetical protein
MEKCLDITRKMYLRLSSGDATPSRLTDTIRTAGTILQVLSESSEMKLYLIENLSSSSDHLGMLNQSIDLPNITDAINMLDGSGLIELVDYQWLSPKLVLITYGPGNEA